MTATYNRESILSFLNVIALRHPNWFNFTDKEGVFTDRDLDIIDFKKIVHCIESGQSYDVGVKKVPPPIPPKLQSIVERENSRNSIPSTPTSDRLSYQRRPSSAETYIVNEENNVHETIIHDDKEEESLEDSIEINDDVTISLAHVIDPAIIKHQFSILHTQNNEIISSDLPFNDDSKWSRNTALSDEDWRRLSYENLILATGMFRRVSKSELETLLSIFRNMLKINNELHSELIMNILMDDMTLHISTSINSDIFKILTPTEKLPKIFFESHLIKRRIEVIQNMENIESKKRNIWLLLNTLVLIFRKKEKFDYYAKNSFDKISIKEESNFRKMLKVCFENLLAGIPTESDTNLISQLKDWVQDVNEYPIQLSVQLYQPFINMSIETIFENDSDDEDEKDLDEIDEEFNELHASLKTLRYMLGIKDLHTHIMVLSLYCQKFEKTKTNSSDEEFILERIRNTLNLIEKEIIDKIIESKDQKEFFDQYFSQCYNSFGVKLLNYTQVYGTEEQPLKEHLQVFSKLVEITNLIYMGSKDYKKLLSEYIALAIRSSAYYNYTILKGDSPITETLFSMIEFEKQLQEEIQEEHGAIDSIFSTIYQHCHLEYDFAICGLLFYDVAKLIPTIGDLNADVLRIFEILGERWIPQLCSVLHPEDLEEKETIPTNLNINDIFKPLTIVSVPLLDAWMSKINQLFNEYLVNSIQLEKWTPITKDVKYSTSAVDVIGFLERSFSFLQRIKIPVVQNYVRQYIQLSCDMIDLYCGFILSPLPQLHKLKPNLPQIKKIKSNTLFSKKSSSKLKEEDELFENLERNRLKFGQQFNLDILFLRLNNVIYVRKKLLNLTIRASEHWLSTMNDVFCMAPSENEGNYEDIFSETMEKIKKTVKDIIEFIAHWIVYIRLWPRIFYNQIYYESTSDTMLTRILSSELDPILGSIVENVDEESLSEVIIRNVFKVFLIAFEMVVLDGGIHRKFYPEDFQYILDDLSELEAYFYQDGNGISSQEFILQNTARLKTIAGIMKLSTDELIRNPEFGFFSKLPEVSNSSPISKLTIYKILYHRYLHDKMAKKFIKKTPLPVQAQILSQVQQSQLRD